MAVKVNRIQKMVHKDGLLPVGTYKAEGRFKSYYVYIDGQYSSVKVSRTYHKNEIVNISHDTYCLFYEKLSEETNCYLVECYLNEVSKTRRQEFFQRNNHTLQIVLGKYFNKLKTKYI